MSALTNPDEKRRESRQPHDLVGRASFAHVHLEEYVENSS